MTAPRALSQCSSPVERDIESGVRSAVTIPAGWAIENWKSKTMIRGRNGEQVSANELDIVLTEQKQGHQRRKQQLTLKTLFPFNPVLIRCTQEAKRDNVAIISSPVFIGCTTSIADQDALKTRCLNKIAAIKAYAEEKNVDVSEGHLIFLFNNTEPRSNYTHDFTDLLRQRGIECPVKHIDFVWCRNLAGFGQSAAEAKLEMEKQKRLASEQKRLASEQELRKKLQSAAEAKLESERELRRKLHEREREMQKLRRESERAKQKLQEVLKGLEESPNSSTQKVPVKEREGNDREAAQRNEHKKKGTLPKPAKGPEQDPPANKEKPQPGHSNQPTRKSLSPAIATSQKGKASARDPPANKEKPQLGHSNRKAKVKPQAVVSRLPGVLFVALLLLGAILVLYCFLLVKIG
eukprot:TRINITY_DN1055_c0_g1_i6.p1 TRINITY_DN1055_c0_g1~~TRINITY_DN1055_c0_g1_i6.p1  ORF type:complete len:407 (+),score=55.94 TRINITY_DN1055_c0_g1_i6:147-1367(+)